MKYTSLKMRRATTLLIEVSRQPENWLEEFWDGGTHRWRWPKIYIQIIFIYSADTVCIGWDSKKSLEKSLEKSFWKGLKNWVDILAFSNSWRNIVVSSSFAKSGEFDEHPGFPLETQKVYTLELSAISQDYILCLTNKGKTKVGLP